MTQTGFVTREEFESVKAELEKLGIRVEVIDAHLGQLTGRVADLAENLGAFRDEMDSFRGEVNARFDALVGQVNARFTALEQTQSAILSAVLRLLPRDQ